MAILVQFYTCALNWLKILYLTEYCGENFYLKVNLDVLFAVCLFTKCLSLHRTGGTKW